MPQKKITSLANPQVKQIVQLRKHKVREETGLTIVEGLREVALAHRCGVTFQELYVCHDFLNPAGKELAARFQSQNVSTVETDKAVFEKISFGDRQEGILGVCRPKRKALKDLSLSGAPLMVVMEGIEKPGNLGAVLRTCDAAGVDAVLVVEGATDIFNPNVIRASVGAVFSVFVVETTNKAAGEFLKEKGAQIILAVSEGGEAHTTVDFKKPSAIILGNEQKGLSSFWISAADKGVTIPMRGKVNSLNVSTSAAILIYEAARQRG